MSCRRKKTRCWKRLKEDFSANISSDDFDCADHSELFDNTAGDRFNEVDLDDENFCGELAQPESCSFLGNIIGMGQLDNESPMKGASVKYIDQNGDIDVYTGECKEVSPAVCSILEEEEISNEGFDDPGLLHSNVWEKIQRSQIDDILFEEEQPDEELLIAEGFTLEEFEPRESSPVVQPSNIQLIYDNAQVNYDDSMLLLMSFCVRHKLSAVAVDDLIRLIYMHCPENANIVSNLREFQIFLTALKDPLVKHYYCPRKQCQVYNGTKEPGHQDKCCVCHESLSKENFFIELPIEFQLRDLLSDPEFLEKLKYRFQRKILNKGAIEDVYDGELYQQLSKEGGFLSNPSNISFLANTDGVSIVRSSGASVWPVYFIINELPPLERTSRKNRLFGGLWFGKGKPHFPTFFRPFTKSIQNLFFQGITVDQSQAGQETFTCKAILLDTSVDAPARAPWQAMKQFNGYNGCGKCKEPGKQLVIGVGKKNTKKHCHIYPFNEQFASTSGHAPARLHGEVKKQALNAMSLQEKGKTKHSVEGILGISVGFSFPHFDVIKGTAIDYMHCVCEGLVDQHLEKWFGSGDNSLFPCFLGGQIEDIESDLLHIKPTSEITRKPRKLEDRHDWKASEKKAWLLYYSIPLLMGRLSTDYIQHYMLLVGATYRLLKCSITSKDLEQASLHLKLYCAQVAGFYGERFQTFNCHQLLHLADDVRQLGPLWTHSCFPFEDYNGDLKDLFHGTQNIPGQIMQSVSILHKIPEVAARTNSSKVRSLYDHMMNKESTKSSKTEVINEKAFVVGALEKVNMDQDDHDVLIKQDVEVVTKEFGPFGHIWTFKRCCVNGTTFHSEAYKKVTVRNNYTVQIDEGSCGSISRFFKVAGLCQNAACSVQEKCACSRRTAYYAVIKQLTSTPLPQSIQGETIVTHIYKIIDTRKRLPIAVNFLRKKLLRVDVSSGSFVCEMPNMFEKD